MTMKIRKATRNDIPYLVSIYNKTFKNTIFSPKKYYKKHIDKGKAEVIEINGKIAGAYIWDINRMKNILKTDVSIRDRYLWLIQVMVDPEHQKQGLGRNLMLDYMMKKELPKRLVCEPQLVEWYKRFGFIVYQNFYHDGKDMYVMLLE